MKTINCTLTLPNNLGGMRLDQALAKLVPDYSRTQIQDWIKNGAITVDGKTAKARSLVIGGEQIMIQATTRPQPVWKEQAIALDIIYEDEALLLINKPAGMVVHPAAGNPDNTLVNALLHHDPQLNELPRAGIVHRLDKDTTGLLVVAKTQPVLMNLTKQLKQRSITRIYQAIVCGVMTSGGMVDEPIGRHPRQRLKMAVSDTGKPATTHYRVLDRYRAHTRVKVQLETGRTHQIRVHMAHIRYPILGDPTYGNRLQLPKNATPALVEKLRGFKRQALHASELSLTHPLTEKIMTWQAPLPEDMRALIEVLKQDAAQSSHQSR
jgi:23S rRNA pseudouridine1911/1915/1917 synthase